MPVGIAVKEEQEWMLRCGLKVLKQFKRVKNHMLILTTGLI